MRTCEHYQPLLLDHVYGLLEAGEMQEVRAHVEACPGCQSALEKVRGQQALLARAARAIHEVPEFSLSSAITGPVKPTTIAASAPLPPAVPSAPPPSATTPGELPARATPAARAFWRSPWLVWVTAAAILLTVGAGVAHYQSTLHGYQEDLAKRRQEYKKIEQEVAALPAKYRSLQTAALGDAHDRATSHLRVIGPAQVQPDAKTNLHVTTRHAEGTLAASTVHVQLVDASTQKVVEETRVNNPRGETQVELAAARARPGSKLDLRVEALFAHTRASVQETIQVAEPVYAARIDTNKMAYTIRDVLFFRVLVLDRYHLQPPAQPMWLRVQLFNPKNEVVAQLHLPTGDGGMLAGELPIEQHFLAGNYVLEVQPATAQAVLPIAGGSTAALLGSPMGLNATLAAPGWMPAATATASVQAARQPLEIVRDLSAPDIQFEKDRYFPGEMVTGMLPIGPVASERGTATFGNVTVPATIQPQLSTRGSLPGSGGGLNPQAIAGGKSAPSTDKKLDKSKTVEDAQAVRRFTARMPENVPAGANQLPFTLKLQDGLRKEEYRAVVPLLPTDYAIDFFPEGGDLIAGITNRVFYRVRSRTGEPVTGEGWVILLSNKSEPVDSRYQLGLGSFDFVPDAKETYTVRITSPVKTSEVAQPFARLGIRSTGLVVHVPAAVGKQGEPIALMLRNQGPERRLMLVAQCRGQIVDQRWIDVKTGTQDFTLVTPPDTRGMIRVTAYEVQGSFLEPLAERLVYRTPAQSLDLNITLNTQQLEAGRKIMGKVSARTERGEAAASWMLASVVDERFQPQPRSLSAHFLLLNETGSGAALDNAQIILHDGPESVQVLERFLGTHGWRRFVRTQEPNLPLLARAAEKGSQEKGLKEKAPRADDLPLLFSRENAPLESLQKQYQDQLAQTLTPLHQDAAMEQIELEDQQERLSEAVNLARLAVWNFENQVQLWLRLALGALVALLLGVSLLLMAIGLDRIVRRHRTATAVFGSALACLAVCLILVLTGVSFAPMEINAPTAENPVGPFSSHLKRLEWLQPPALPRTAAPTPAGEFALRSLPSGALGEHQQGEVSLNMENSARREKTDRELAQPMLEQLAKALVLRDRDEARGNRDAKNGMTENEAMRVRHEQARKAMQSFDAGPYRTGNAAAKSSNTPHPKNFKPDVAPPATSPGIVSPLPSHEGHKESQEEKRRMEELVRTREFAYQHVPNLISDTLLWSPTLWLQNGAAEVHFDIASGQASYRVLLLGHSPGGTFGYYEKRLDVPAVGR